MVDTVKSSECPVYNGTNATPVLALFVDWREKRLTIRQVVKYVHSHNIEYLTAKRFERILELARIANPAIRQDLLAFMREYKDWIGEYPVLAPRRTPIRTRKSTPNTTVVRTYQKDGTVVDKPILIKHGRQKPTTDDQKNGWYYLERQLQYVRWREK